MDVKLRFQKYLKYGFSEGVISVKHDLAAAVHLTGTNLKQTGDAICTTWPLDVNRPLVGSI